VKAVIHPFLGRRGRKGGFGNAPRRMVKLRLNSKIVVYCRTPGINPRAGRMMSGRDRAACLVARTRAARPGAGQPRAKRGQGDGHTRPGSTRLDGLPVRRGSRSRSSDIVKVTCRCGRSYGSGRAGDAGGGNTDSRPYPAACRRAMCAARVSFSGNRERMKLIVCHTLLAHPISRLKHAL
jgi:hypothetical protein